MKKSGILVASMAAATAISASTSSDLFTNSKIQASASTSSDFFINSKIKASNKESNSSDNDQDNSTSLRRSMTSTDKFAPRFDGLRFIETLVTAHR